MLNMAGQCKFEKIYTDCKRAVLKRFLKSPDHTEFVEKMKTPGKGLGCLSENDANMLFMALLKAFHDSQKDAKRNRNVYSLQHLMVCNFDSEEYIDGLLQVLQSSERQT
jgi:glutaredoxin-related protein